MHADIIQGNKLTYTM